MSRERLVELITEPVSLLWHRMILGAASPTELIAESSILPITYILVRLVFLSQILFLFRVEKDN